MRRTGLLLASFILIGTTAAPLTATPLYFQIFGWQREGTKTEGKGYAFGLVGSHVRGKCIAQMAPGYAINHSTEKLQLGGVVSISEKCMDHKSVLALIFAGITRGCRLRGLEPNSFLEGIQIALFNYASSGKGLQIGILNMAGNQDIKSIGLINIRRGGIRRWLTSFNNRGEISTALQSGGEHLYTVLETNLTTQGSLFTMGWQTKNGIIYGDMELGLFVPPEIEEIQEMQPLIRFRPGIRLIALIRVFSTLEFRIVENQENRFYASLGVSVGR